MVWNKYYAPPLGAVDAEGAGGAGGVCRWLENIIESKKKIVGAKKILKTKSKIHHYFRVLHSIVPLLVRVSSQLVFEFHHT